MQINRPAMKEEARNFIGKGNPSPIIVALLFVTITYILGVLSTRLIGIQVDINKYYNSIMSGNYDYIYNLVLNNRPGALAWLLEAAIELMTMILSAGFIIFSLNVVRSYKASYGNLFDGFGIFFRILWLNILSYIFIFLWSLLLVVPGIIAAYRYRMAIYLLLDNPEMSVLSCIRESKRMMAGHKGELFVLDLSFIGWYILTFVPFVSIWVTPYTQLTYAIYYDSLRGSTGHARPSESFTQE